MLKVEYPPQTQQHYSPNSKPSLFPPPALAKTVAGASSGAVGSTGGVLMRRAESETVGSARKSGNSSNNSSNAATEWAIPGLSHSNSMVARSSSNTDLTGSSSSAQLSGSPDSSSHVKSPRTNKKTGPEPPPSSGHSTMVITTENGITTYSCSLCRVRYPSQSLLMRHVQYSTMHKESIVRKQQRQEQQNKRIASAVSAENSNNNAEWIGLQSDNSYDSQDDYDYEDYYSDDEYYDSADGDGTFERSESETSLGNSSHEDGQLPPFSPDGHSNIRPPFSRRSSATDFELGTSPPMSISKGHMPTISRNTSQQSGPDAHSLSSKGKKVHFSANQPTKDRVEMEAYINSLLTNTSDDDYRGPNGQLHHAVSASHLHDDEKAHVVHLKEVVGLNNSGWSRAVSKIRMHNEFARVTQVLCAHYHATKTDRHRAQALGKGTQAISKIIFEGTKFIKTSPSSGETVELVMRLLDDEQTKRTTPGGTSVVEVIGYYPGTGRQSEIGKTYLSYDSLTILLHDEIKKAASEYRAASVTRNTVPAATVGGGGQGNTTPPDGNSSGANGAGSSKGPSTAATSPSANAPASSTGTAAASRKDGIIASNEKETTAPVVPPLGTVGSPNKSSGTLPSVKPTAGNSSTHLFHSPPRGSTKMGTNSNSSAHSGASTSRPGSPVHSARVTGSQTQRNTSRVLTRRSFERDPRADRSGKGSSSGKGLPDAVNADSKSASLSGAAGSGSATGGSVLASASAPSLLQHQLLHGYGQEHHDGIERGVTADVIAHFIMSHLALDRLYVGGAYTMHVVSSGARVGEVLSGMLDKFTDVANKEGNNLHRHRPGHRSPNAHSNQASHHLQQQPAPSHKV
jgi:hypothetical protein